MLTLWVVYSDIRSRGPKIRPRSIFDDEDGRSSAEIMMNCSQKKNTVHIVSVCHLVDSDVGLLQHPADWRSMEVSWDTVR